MASKAALMRRKSADEKALRSRSAALVISKAHCMPPFVERDVISAPVRPPSLCDGRALFRRRLLVAYLAQPKVKLQRIAYDRRPAALAAPRLFFDQRAHLRR